MSFNHLNIHKQLKNSYIMSEYLSIMMKFASARHNPFFHLFPPLWHVSSAETSNPTSLINYANLIHASFATSSPSPFSTLFLLSLSQFSRLVIWIFVTPWTTVCQASLSITNSKSLLKLMSIESVMPFNHLILCCPLLLLPSIFPRIRVFSKESFLHQVAEVLVFQLQYQSFHWIFRTDFL